ncbi:MAG TPA: hypothetical protein VEI94_15760 [Candidatus Bathyarchaeia archaeon]|nr:hypothetical protein [Candidatus Bathyarchaeia archaeon]
MSRSSSGGARMRCVQIVSLCALFSLGSRSAAVAADDFVNFESGQVRPLALSVDGNTLYAINTPDNRVEVFAIGTGSLTHVADVEVGLEPVAVAARTNDEIWVVNHLSDSVSVVDVSDPTAPHVVATLNVGDEPRDIIFARADRSRAYITTAHRGQNMPASGPQLTAEGVGRSDVWVFNATNLAAAPTVLTFFGDTPRALAVTPDGATVYAAVFHSGNQTTTITEAVVSASGGVPPFPAGFTANPPDTGLIVKFNNTLGKWEDERGAATKDWTSLVRFSLPDNDVFVIGANTDPPTVTAPDANGLQGFQHVGTVLFNMAVNPANQHLYVSNLESRNQVRFEPFINANQGVRGHIAESRITIINPSGPTVSPHHLNAHVNFGCEPPGCTPDASEIPLSLAFPLGMVFNSTGSALYVAAFGSGKVAKLDPTALDASPGSVSAVRIAVGGGPTGLALDETRSQLYVLNRFDETISIVNTTSNTVVGTATPLKFDPEPPAVKNGRHFLYNATFSAHGETACASCHIFGDFDSLAWDLGDPFGAVTPEFGPLPPPGIVLLSEQYHPLKGPMTTQSLRGLDGVGPMHWRGDRNGGAADPGNSQASFKAFNVAFPGLLGAPAQLSTQDMQAFTDFVLTIKYPPNPIAALNGTQTAAQSAGQDTFENKTSDTEATCSGCHVLPFGTGGFLTFENEPQQFKVAHLRNLYQKIGMFGTAAALDGTGHADPNLGPQVRGFGFLHDGSIPTVFNFHNAPVFAALTNTERRNIEQFVLTTFTGLAPIVGQQVTANAGNFSSAGVISRVNLLIARAGLNPPECDLVVKGIFGAEPRGWLYHPATGKFEPDRVGDPEIDEPTLRGQASAAGQELTYTCVPPGSGMRIALDRDGDGYFDGDELAAGSDPGDPASIPDLSSGVRGSALTLGDDNVPPIRTTLKKLVFKSLPFKGSASGVTLPAEHSTGDPTANGLTGGGGQLTVYNPGTGEKFAVALPVGNWLKHTGAHFVLNEFRYTDPHQLTGPVTLVSVKSGKLVVKANGAGWGYSLSSPPQGQVAVRVQLGTQPAYCAVFPAKTGGHPPTSTNFDKLDKFIGAPNSAAPVTCPPVP